MKQRKKTPLSRGAPIGIALLALLSSTACSVSDARSAREANASTTNSQVTTSPAPIASAAEYTQVCGICHLANGEGVPGAFPPLNQRLGTYANNDAGRDFLVGIIKNGLYGEISIDDVVYNGSMPPLGFQVDAEKTAALLNYALKTFAATEAGFTASEIETRNTSISNTSGAALRKNALAKSSE